MIIHIDEFSFAKMMLKVRGYVVTDSKSLIIRLNKHVDVNRIMRSDVNIAYDLDDEYLAGFILERSIFSSTKLYFIEGDQTQVISFSFLRYLKKTYSAFMSKFKIRIKEYGFLGTMRLCIKRLFSKRKQEINIYQNWIEENKLNKQDYDDQINHIFQYRPKFSIVVPTYNTPIVYLKEMIHSIEKQTYSNWELCIADASDEEETKSYLKDIQSNKIKVKFLRRNLMISGNTNEALTICEGEFIILLDHDDLISANALFEIVSVLNKDKRYDFIYTDEDKIDAKGIIYSQPHFKPDYAIDNLRSYNYITHLAVIRKSLLDTIGNFDSSCDGAQDYDLFLRICDATDRIYHIPKTLYHWRIHETSTSADAGVKPYVTEAGKHALTKHLERNNIKGTVKDGLFPTSYKIDYDIIGKPLISILIPNKDHINDLDRCIKSILNKSTYKNYEIIVVENNSVERATFEYYEQLSSYDHIKVVTWKGHFNYSKINNYGRQFCKGSFILLLNNDVEVISDNWLEEMLMHAQRKGVGAVGAKLYYPDGRIQHAGVILGIGSVAGHSHKYFERNDFGYMGRLKIVQDLSAVTAACMMMKATIFDELEGFSDDFAVAFNDVDLCLRIREAGYLIIFTPYSELVHHESLSRGLEDSPEKIKRFQGEIDLFEDKWGLYRYDPYYNQNLTLEKEDFSYKASF